MDLIIERDPHDLVVINIYNLSEEGGPLIKCFPNGSFKLYSIPMYGGEPRFETDVASIQEGLDTGATWT